MATDKYKLSEDITFRIRKIITSKVSSYNKLCGNITQMISQIKMLKPDDPFKI